MTHLLLLLACTDREPSPQNPGTSLDSELESDSDHSPPDSRPGGGEDSSHSEDTGSPHPEYLPNLIVISIDTLRRGDVGRYSGEDVSPFLDSLLAKGLTLDNHRSCSGWTFPSIICALGGGDLVDLGYIPTDQNGKAPLPIPDDLLVLADYTRLKGYTSALVSGNGFVSPEMGVGRSYDSTIWEVGCSSTSIREWGIDQLDMLTLGGGPWMLHLHFIDPHSPYNPAPNYLVELQEIESVKWDFAVDAQMDLLEDAWPRLSEEEQALLLKHLSIRYLAEIKALDDQLSILFEQMEERGVLDDAVVMIWSDHGEQFFEHGSLGHGTSLYDDENRAIASFIVPGVSPISWEQPTAHQDILPTLYDLLGWEPEIAFTGLPARVHTSERPLYSVDYRLELSRVALNLGPQKLYYLWDGTREYYNISEDPGELNDLAGSVYWEDMEEMMDAYVQTIYEDFFPTGPAPL